MLRLAICDDDANERAGLRRLMTDTLVQSGYPFAIVEYPCGEPLVADYEDGDADFDLIFLDIFMGALNGIQTAQKIRVDHQSVSIVFLTSSPDFALEGYDVQAMGYLLKPLIPQKAVTLLERFLHKKYAQEEKALLLRERTQMIQIPHREILAIESSNSVLLVYTKSGKVHRMYRKLDELESSLCKNGFLRCHQSFLVNLAHITTAEQYEFILSNDAHIPIRRQDAKKLRGAYFEYLLQQAK